MKRTNVSKKKTIWVEIKMTLPVRVPVDKDYPVEFVIEENSCPGTSQVYSSLKAIMQYHNKRSTCWGCAMGGENKIVEKPDWIDNHKLEEVLDEKN